MGRKSREKRERRERGEGPVAAIAHGRSRASLLALLEAASVSPIASQYLPSLAVIFESLANGRTRVGTKPADVSMLQPLVQAAHAECPPVRAVEDFLPHDPRFEVRVEWAGEMFRMVAGSLERPTSDVETLRRLSAIIDPVLHEHADYGLTDVVELMLRRIDAVASALAPAWPADLEQELGSAPQLRPEELAVAASLPSLEVQLAQCSSPERAMAALEAHTVPAKSLRRDDLSMIATFDSTIAIRHGQSGVTPLPAGLIVEALNALAGELAAKALTIDPSLDYKWLTAGWRYIGGLLDAAGLDVIGPMSDERYPGLHSVIRYNDSQYLAVSVAGGLDHSALQDAIMTAATRLETVRPGSTLRAASGPVTIPASARLQRLLIVAPPQAATLWGPDGAKCAQITLKDLDWMRRTIVRDEIDLWYFVRDRVEQPRIGQIHAWDGIDLWEAWKDNGKSFYVGAREIDVLRIEPHHSLREWRKASEQYEIEQALVALDMGRISAWPLHSLDGESILVGNARAGVLFDLMLCDTPVAVALHPSSGVEPFPRLAHDLGQCVVHKLRCARDELVNLMNDSGRASLTIEFAFEDDGDEPAIRVASLDDGALTLGCSPRLVNLLQTDSLSIEAHLGVLIAEALASGADTAGFIEAWCDAPAGIRFDALTVGPKIQETPTASSLHESHRSMHLAKLGAYLKEAGIAPGTYRGHEAKHIDSTLVAPWLTARLSRELKQFDFSAVLSHALTQLECTSCHRWWKVTKSAYQVGSPRSEDRLSATTPELLSLARAIGLMIEEILAQPPIGTKQPTEYDWQELLCSATLAREAGYRSEALHLELADVSLTITQHFEVSFVENDVASSIDMEAFERDRGLATLPDPIPIGASHDRGENEQQWAPIAVRLPEYEAIERSLQETLGFGIDAIMGILDSAIHWPASAPRCVELASLDELAEESHETNPSIPLDSYMKAADWLSLGTVDFEPQEPTIEHWEIEARSTRIAIRPLARQDANVWVAPWTVVAAKQTWVNYLNQHRMPIPDVELPAPVVSALGQARQQRQRNFEKNCVAAIAGLPLTTIARLRENSAHKHSIAHLSGEIDVLSIDPSRSVIFVIEAKDPFVPLSARSLSRQIAQFHEINGYVDKLDQKVTDIAISATSLAANKSIERPDRDWQVVGVMVTRHITPAAYVKECQTLFCTIRTLRDAITETSVGC